MRYAGAALFLALTFAAPGLAEVGFTPFAGQNALRIGDGGTQVTRNGIDYWIMGGPARDYRVLGTLIDTRSTLKSAGDPVDSKAVADRIREAGGDGAILVSQEDRTLATSGNRQLKTVGNAAHGNGWSAPAGERSVTMVVIKYSGATQAK